jgi:putative iron-dependent peroxidase
MNCQKSVTQEQGSTAIYITLKANGEHTSILKELKEIPQLAEKIGSVDPDSHLSSSISFGSDFWNKVSPNKKPKLIKNFETIIGNPAKAPATGGDIFIHIKSNRHDLSFELATRAKKLLGSAVSVMDESHGFTYLDSRDLTGFIDGTANPEGTEREAVALIGEEDPEFAGGSYLLTQKFHHSMGSWEKLDVEEQEHIVGRAKKDSEFLRGERQKEYSHVSRAETHVGDFELKIVRHSLPIGNAMSAMGLFFIAYAKEVTTFDLMLARIYGTSGDGISDKLMEYTEAITGAYFFTPSIETLAKL